MNWPQLSSATQAFTQLLGQAGPVVGGDKMVSNFGDGKSTGGATSGVVGAMNVASTMATVGALFVGVVPPFTTAPGVAPKYAVVEVGRADGPL